jgi:hypothetical protein
VLDVHHNAVLDGAGVAVNFRDRSRECGRCHPAHVCLDIEDRPSTHARVARVTNNVPVVGHALDHGLRVIDDKGRLPVLSDVADERTLRID